MTKDNRLQRQLVKLAHTARRGQTLMRHYGLGGMLAKARRTLLPPKAYRRTWRAPSGAYERAMVAQYDFTPADVQRSRIATAAHNGPLDVRSVAWFLPDFEHAFYGGMQTILRFAAGFARLHGVHSRFVIENPTRDAATYQQRISAAFSDLAGAPVHLLHTDADVAALPPVDASIATLWTTAYRLLRFNRTKRKCYFVQDFEPLFFPAGSTSAQVEATYRFGFYGLMNTVTLQQIYERDYAGRATSFRPCVETGLFSGGMRPQTMHAPWTVFFYARPDFSRNGFELGTAGLRQLKQRLGTQVRIVSAGQHWNPADYALDGVIENLGLLSYAETAALYRRCDAGLVMMFTRHPSYLPFELMASGCLVVTNLNSATTWLLKDGENCLLTLPSASCIAETLARGLEDAALRQQITSTALNLIQREYADWDSQITHVYAALCDRG